MIKAAAVFAAALILRLIVGSDLAQVPLFRTPQLDSLEYVAWAQRIAAGDFHWPYAPTHGPGYPYFLGTLLAIGGGSLLFIQIIQSTVGAFTAVFLFWIAQRLYGDLAALAAGAFAATYGPLLLIDNSRLAEGLFLFLLAALLLVIVSISPPRLGQSEDDRGDARDRLRQHVLFAILAGLLLGLAVITRPTALLLVPIVGIELFRRTRLLGAAILFVVAFSLPLSPVVLQNWMATGRIMAVQSAGGVNFYIANSPRDLRISWSRPGGEWDVMRGAAWRAGIHDPAAEDPFYSSRAMTEIRAEPLRFLRLLLIKSFWTFQAEEIRDSHSIYFFKLFSPVLSLAPGFGLLLSLAVIGLAVAIRQRHPSFLLGGFAFVMLCSVTGLIVGMRYRLPVVLPFFVWAGLGIAVFVTAVRERKRMAVLLMFAVVITILLLSRIGRHSSTRDFSEEWALNAISLLSEGRTAEAHGSVDKSLRLDPNRGLTHRVRGDIHARAGQWKEAENAYRTAIHFDPTNVTALGHLALVHLQRGEIDRGRELLERANAIKADAEVMTNLARLDYQAGRSARAEHLLTAAAQRTHADAAVHVGLAHIAFERGELSKAEREAERALQIDPAQQQAARLLARIVARKQSGL